MTATVGRIGRFGDFVLYRDGTRHSIHNDSNGQWLSNLDYEDLRHLAAAAWAGKEDVTSQDVRVDL